MIPQDAENKIDDRRKNGGRGDGKRADEVPLTDEEARKVSGGRAGMVLHPCPKCQTPYMVPRHVLEFGLKLPSCPRCTFMAAKGENP